MCDGGGQLNVLSTVSTLISYKVKVTIFSLDEDTA